MPATFPHTPLPLHPLLRRALEDAHTHHRTVLARLPEPHAPRDPWAFGEGALAEDERFSYWAHPAENLSAHGIGEAYVLTTNEQKTIGEIGRKHADIQIFTHDDLRELPLWFGGFSFDSAAAHTESWTAWPQHELLTHAITAVRKDGRSFLVLTIHVTPDDNEASLQTKHLALRERVRAIRQHRPANEERMSLQFSEGQHQNQWRDSVQTIQRAIAEQTLQKLVLARRALAPWPEHTASSSRHACAVNALHALRTRYPQCATFAIGRPTPSGPSMFFGSTPEVLIQRTENTLRTMALAGTISRGENGQRDRENEQTLLGSEKDRAEHQYVVQNIQKNLRDLGIDAHVPSTPDIVSFPNVHHLQTRIWAQAPPHLALLEIAESLHPTPAICGTPTNAARLWLRAHEHMDRGWYAGGVFWLDDHGNGSVHVALRSAISTKDAVVAYAGAGIVQDSNADQEWHETEAKLQPIRQAFAAGSPSDPESSDDAS